MPLVFLAAPAAQAVSTPSCHCFRDRSFDPERPSAADPYLLATTQNTLFSLVFEVPKKSVVQAKMTGTTGANLWVAYWVAARSGLRAEDLLEARRGSNGWTSAFCSFAS